MNFFDPNSDDKDIKQSNIDANNKPASINKTTININSIERLCEAYIKSKYIRIVGPKKMMPTTKRLQKVHPDLWGFHNPVSISKKNYNTLLLNKFTQEFWILFLRSKNKFFDIFELWLLKIEASGTKLDCLQADDRGEFINATF